MFRGIVDGVRFIHRAGIIHSDIKHVNVVVQENTLNPFVIDLGSGIEANNLVEG
jgi:serine/threonine protein kinase